MNSSTDQSSKSALELEKELRELDQHRNVQNTSYLQERALLLCRLRSKSQQEYFDKYGEWDWIVRRDYMDLVKSYALEYPYDPSTRGYDFELYNFTPRLPLEIQTEDYRLREGVALPQYHQECLRWDGLTEFVSEANIGQCRLSRRIVDAFKLLPLLGTDPRFHERGFLISPKADTWENISKEDNRTLNGYKEHLDYSFEQ